MVRMLDSAVLDLNSRPMFYLLCALESHVMLVCGDLRSVGGRTQHRLRRSGVCLSHVFRSPQIRKFPPTTGCFRSDCGDFISIFENIRDKAGPVSHRIVYKLWGTGDILIQNWEA